MHRKQPCVDYTATKGSFPTRALVLLAFSISAAFAQPNAWSRLTTIRSNQCTHVHLTNGTRLDGRFVTTTESNIVIRTGKSNETIAGDQVGKVSVRTAGKPGRNALRGAAIYSFGMLGAGIGAIFPGYQTLYRLPKK